MRDGTAARPPRALGQADTAVDVTDGASDAPLLEARGLTYGYGRQAVLNGVDLTIRRGEVVALLGANGAGKSTLLRLCLGLIRPSSGAVTLAGRALAHWPRRALARHVAYVPQGHECPFPYTVREVVAMGGYHRTGAFGRATASELAEVDTQLARLGLSALADRPYTQISGGQRQLALMCRALVQRAPLLILDEPASALDFGHQIRLLSGLRRLAEQGHAALMSTHHPQHARMIAHRVVLMHGGRIVADGSPDTVLTRRRVSALYGLTDSDLSGFDAMRGDWIGEDRDTASCAAGAPEAFAAPDAPDARP